jgi:hypothetical protein
VKALRERELPERRFGVDAKPNKTLQQTAAAILVFWNSPAPGAAAAAERGRSSAEELPVAKSDRPLTEAEAGEVERHVTGALQWFDVAAGSRSPDQLQECIYEVVNLIRSQPDWAREDHLTDPRTGGARQGGVPAASPAPVPWRCYSLARGAGRV